MSSSVIWSSQLVLPFTSIEEITKMDQKLSKWQKEFEKNTIMLIVSSLFSVFVSVGTATFLKRFYQSITVLCAGLGLTGIGLAATILAGKKRSAYDRKMKTKLVLSDNFIKAAQKAHEMASETIEAVVRKEQNKTDDLATIASWCARQYSWTSESFYQHRCANPFEQIKDLQLSWRDAVVTIGDKLKMLTQLNIEALNLQSPSFKRKLQRVQRAAWALINPDCLIQVSQKTDLDGKSLVAAVRRCNWKEAMKQKITHENR